MDHGAFTVTIVIFPVHFIFITFTVWIAPKSQECVSGKKKEPKPKLLGSGYLRVRSGFPLEWVGAKKLGMSFETHGNQTFWRDIPGFCRDIPGAPEKFEKKKCLIIVP